MSPTKSMFSRAQVFFISAIAGMLPAAYMVAKNDERSKGNRGGTFKILGYIFLVITWQLGLFLERLFLSGTRLYHEHSVAVAAGLLLLTQIVLSVPFLLLAMKLCKGWGGTTLAERRVWFKLLPYLLIGLAINAAMLRFGTFFFTFFLIYLLPTIYLHSKIRRLFVSEKKRAWFTFFFILMAAVFPLSGRFIPFHQDAFSRAISLTGYYYATILLYVFLFYLLSDLLLLLNKPLKIVPWEKTRSGRFRVGLFSVIMAISLLVVAKGVYNFNNSMVQAFEITVPKKEGNLDHLRIAMAADLHFGEITSQFFTRQFVDKINDLEPDIVLLAGDIIDSNHSNERIAFIEDQLTRIRSRYGVFASEGNHELYRRRYRFDFFENANINLLRDSVISIENSFQIVSRKDRHDATRLTIEELMARVSGTLPVILIDHQPYDLHQAYNNAVDMQFSGHTHYGQLVPINFIVDGIYELAWGYRKIRDTHFFVTCGAQGWGPQVKTGSRSEIMLIDVRFE
jgi:uncharacterized protein